MIDSLKLIKQSDFFEKTIPSIYYLNFKTIKFLSIYSYNYEISTFRRMFASDLYIQKENNLYFLKYLDKKIKCTDSDDFVADKNLELISFILEDLDKCGELKINKNNELVIDTGMPLAYYIFSAQKLQIENEKNFKELCDYLLYFPIHDFSLI